MHLAVAFLLVLLEHALNGYDLSLSCHCPMPSTKAELKRCIGMFAYYARWIKNYSAKVRSLIANTKLSLNSSGQFAYAVMT